jgi:hypothetical protein
VLFDYEVIKNWKRLRLFCLLLQLLAKVGREARQGRAAKYIVLINFD